MPAAARLGDPIGHSKAMTGFLAGAAVGFAATVGVAVVAGAVASAVAAEVVSGGLATPLVAGVLVTAGELAVNVVAGGYLASKAEEIGERAGSGMTSATGTIVEGSSNVSINGKPAAFVTRKVVCSKTGHQPGDMIAEGASTVFINGKPAARVGDRIVCGGVVISGSSNVFIGSPKKQVLKVNPEVPDRVRTAVFIASLLPAGGGLLRAVRPALQAVAEKGLTGSLKAGGKVLGEAMERRSLGPKGENFYKTKYLKEKYAEDLKETRTFKTNGVSEKDAVDYLGTDEGKAYIKKLQEADPTSKFNRIERRAIDQIRSGSSLPSSSQTSSSMIKIVPEGNSVSPHSPFFMTEEGLQEAQASGKTLSNHFGLPVISESDVYDIYRTTPNGEVTVYTSRVAPTSELGGLVTRDGGAGQTLILNRGEWSEPVKIGRITNKGVME
ncbi:MAG: PAAR domain-containing protein [Acetobacter aceti]|uniref:Double-stranded DNA deaminase toxin A prePAAR motif domain-containing protein n=1 Tax=Acetobacter aceti TaxID=435 RepID=A0A1U9KCW0_ACEAC|nr:PAAR domain-containing protein [Acetobacter aceti]AQS83644.1 hypothetical protein A0U92_01400 [Acetobacter aceti]